MTRQDLIDKIKEKKEDQRLVAQMMEWQKKEMGDKGRETAIGQNGNVGTHYFQNDTNGATRLFYTNEQSGCMCDCDDCDFESPYTNCLEDSFTNQTHDKPLIDLEQDVLTKAQERKATPVYSGVLKYFPNAIKEVAKASQAGNDQHHPGTPLHWDMEKSKDEYDALTRHLMDHSINPIDDDGMYHLTKVAWRALAGLERFLTDKY